MVKLVYLLNPCKSVFLYTFTIVGSGRIFLPLYFIYVIIYVILDLEDWML